MNIEKTRFCALLLVGASLAFPTCGCEKRDAADTVAETALSESRAVSDKPLLDKPLADFQKQLLTRAFETASAIPLNPHIKPRSLAQEKVVATCLAMDQPARALEYIEHIANWRKYLGYTTLAYYCADRDQTTKAEHFLMLASGYDKNVAEWRRDRILAKVAQTYALLGDISHAEKIEAGLNQKAETGKLAATKAQVAEETSFDEQIKDLEALMAQGDFDITRNALNSLAQLYNRFYENTQRRSQVEEVIRSSWAPVPVFVRMDLLMQLGQFALNHDDSTAALPLIDQAQEMLEAGDAPPEFLMAWLGQFAKLRYQAGDMDKAHADVQAGLTVFENKKKFIFDIDRASALRPLAEAGQSMEDGKTALLIYKKAVEEGIGNPNPKPRAEDLSATCCSMAFYRLEPDAELWSRIRQIQAELEHP